MLWLDEYLITINANKVLLLWFLLLGWYFSDIPWWVAPGFFIYVTNITYRIFLPGARERLIKALEADQKVRENALQQVFQRISAPEQVQNSKKDGV